LICQRVPPNTPPAIAARARTCVWGINPYISENATHNTTKGAICSNYW